MFLVSPMGDEDEIAVRVMKGDFAAGHVFRTMDIWHFESVGDKVLAQSGKVGRVHVMHGRRRGRVSRFGAEEHERAAFTVQARPPQVRFAAVGVYGFEPKQLIEADRSFDIRDMQHRR